MAMRLSLQCGPSKTDLETLKSNLSLKYNFYRDRKAISYIINLHGICHKGCVEQIAFFFDRKVTYELARRHATRQAWGFVEARKARNRTVPNNNNNDNLEGNLGRTRLDGL